ncbi:unnamed protein product [Brugia timori]|uniref:Uncharacterized protein n=1 Tax=Brugia timori TaxID=42155 RepID=A0A3P7UTB2_9BILA|nr:unnamed protein product [Brugia timori]
MEPPIQGSTSVKSGGNILLPRIAETSSGQRSTGCTESDLSFLDPKRQQEVQTRTDFIY